MAFATVANCLLYEDGVGGCSVKSCAALLLTAFAWEFSYADDTQVFDYEVVKEYPHDTRAFTQGLFFRNGWLYESTGLHGSSSIRKVVWKTVKLCSDTTWMTGTLVRELLTGRMP